MFKIIIKYASSIIFAPFILFAALIARYSCGGLNERKLVWGSTPIISYSNWSKAMKMAGYKSETFTYNFYNKINSRGDWDILIIEKYKMIPGFVKNYLAFIESLFKYDCYFISFDGFFLGVTPLNFCQSFFFKVASKKVVVLPYGSDAYVYRNIRSINTIHGLIMSYPNASRDQNYIEKTVNYWVKNADAVVSGIMGPDGLGRWDVLIPSVIMLDLNSWKSVDKYSSANGVDDVVTIAHAPNHRGFKGTEFLIDAVEKLKRTGLKVHLILLEGMQNDEVKIILNSKVDILVEQIICTGHGLNALEGMASGLPVVSNLEDENYILPMRRWSYFEECPLVSATPENLVNTLHRLITKPMLRRELGIAGRCYVEKYHGLDSAQYLFNNVIDYIYGKKDSLISMYHPILGAYPNRSSKIQHPLVNNRIVD